MGNDKSKTSETFVDVVKTQRAIPYFKSVLPSKRIKVKTFQNVLLIWSDANIDKENTDCRNAIAHFRHIINNINTYTNGNECIEFVKSVDKEKICLVISGALGKQIVSRVHNMIQVNTIIIFCHNVKYHEQWTKQWSKIKGVFADATLVFEALKQAAQQCEQDAMPISIIATTDDSFKKNLDQSEPAFMYTRALKEILLTIEFKPQHMAQFLHHCRDLLVNNDKELGYVSKFEQTYHD